MTEKDNEELREIAQVLNGLKCRTNLVRKQADDIDHILNRMQERLRKLYEAHLYKE